MNYELLLSEMVLVSFSKKKQRKFPLIRNHSKQSANGVKSGKMLHL